MADIKRVFLIVLDSVGAGEAPDALAFGDVGAHTIRSCYETGTLEIENLKRLGIGNVDGLDFLGKNDNSIGVVARMTESSAGKDTTIGHWEIAGHVSESPLPTFTDTGFPQELIDKLEAAFGKKILCNKAYSGTEVIKDFGDAHVRTGDPIVYTSADSVLQIATHTDVVPLDKLYEYCKSAREICVGKYGMGRIIARPFCTDEQGNYIRCAGRHDFSIEPPKDLLPEALKNSGYDTIAVGKILDIFAGCGFTRSYYTASNKEGMDITQSIARTDFTGLCFVNLVDFDMLWGHRRDAVAYARGLCEFDEWLGGFLGELKDSDALIITADHGCDPSFTKTTDHTREYVPFLMYSLSMVPENLGTRSTFADIAATVAKLLGADFVCDGTSMI